MVKSSYRVNPNLKRDFVYEILGDRPLRLVVDVGAGAGEVTRRIRLLGGNDTQVIAFEPFPGNHRHFHAATADLEGISLSPKAVSDRRGHSVLFVASRVSGTEEGWEEKVGYSSIGKLPVRSVDWWRNLRRVISSIIQRRGGMITRVEVTTLDYEVTNEIVDFLKVDVQGAERLVLAGARRLLANQQIKLMYIEWAGDPQVPRILEANRYVSYDGRYLGIGDSDLFRDHSFALDRETRLSTGAIGWDMVYEGSDEIGSVLQSVNSAPGCYAQTDLVVLPTDDEAWLLERLVSL